MVLYRNDGFNIEYNHAINKRINIGEKIGKILNTVLLARKRSLL